MKRSFKYYGPKIYNDLPTYARRAVSVNDLKKPYNDYKLLSYFI